jgi:hypothetical protein
MGNPLTITIGDFKEFTITVTKGGIPVDLTGAEQIAFTLMYPGGSAFAQWTLTGGQIAINSPSTAGVATLTVTPAMLPATLWPLSIPTDLTLTGVSSLIDAFGNPTLNASEHNVQLLLPPVPPVIV